MRYALRSWRLGLVLALLLLAAAPALAQSRFVFVDELGELDRAAIERAAEPLLERDAELAIYLVEQGGADDFEQRLEADGFVRGNQARVNFLAIYVSLEPRYSGIRFGDGWNRVLAVNDNGEAIREGALNPQLAEGNFTAAYVDTLAAIEAAAVNPPTPGGGTVVNFNPLPIVIGVFVLLGLGVFGVAFARISSARRALAVARARHDEAREKAGNAIAAVGQRFRTAEEKAQFDRVSYAPADVEALTATQAAIGRRFADAQLKFKATAEELDRHAKPTSTQYDAAAAEYTRVHEQVQALEGELEQLQARRRELDALARQAPEEIDRAKKS